jgi:hypothetical protein
MWCFAWKKIQCGATWSRNFLCDALFQKDPNFVAMRCIIQETIWGTKQCKEVNFWWCNKGNLSLGKLLLRNFPCRKWRNFWTIWHIIWKYFSVIWRVSHEKHLGVIHILSHNLFLSVIHVVLHEKNLNAKWSFFFCTIF